jgi:pyruvate/2-oxoglutarate dehydrogenase complex dihydrolipoamide dehydrogenase (E3) component
VAAVTRHFDAIVIGSGQAGPPLVGRLVAAGMKVALVEREHFGGTCVNTGCMPTKALVASAYAAHLARRGGEFGVLLDGPVRVDMARVKARKDTISGNARHGVEKYLRGMDGCTVLKGHARFEGPDTVRINDEIITAPKIFINVGGRASVPAMPGLETISYLTNTSILEFDRVPRHLVVIGGSYIGLEFAQMYRRFGAEVTVIEKGPRLIGREDPEVSEAIREILEAEGIRIRTSAECLSFAPHSEGVSVQINCSSGEPALTGSDLLLAIGRQPNTDDLGLDRAGVGVDKRGYITVDDRLRTSVRGIWALGDCNGRGAFTHTAYNDYEIVAANLLDGADRKVSDRILGYALFVDPPLGRVGLTEQQARAGGHDVLISTRKMTHVGRAIEKGETQGFMKIIADAGTKQILGAAILGTGGDEAVHGILNAMNAKTPYPDLQWAVPIHPTVSELIPTVLGGLEPPGVS